MNPTYDFAGQVALVTGAAMGMGLATARAFAQSGAAVMLADIDGALGAGEAKRIVAEGGKAIGVACDVAEEAQVAAMIDRTIAEFGRLDMAFNNAGIQVPPSDAADELLENFERVTAVNQRGVWACMKHELRVMRGRGSGAIAAVEYAPRGIRINAVALQNGVTREELIELVTHLAFYTGWPNANTAVGIARKIFGEAA